MQVSFTGAWQPINIADVDVVVADDEDICRAAAASSLKMFGFHPDYVHEAQSGKEALAQVNNLQGTRRVRGLATPTPVILFLDLQLPGDLRVPGSTGLDAARWICEMLAQRRLVREVFLIHSFARSSGHTKVEQRLFHCSMPKTFEVAKIGECWELCQRWWATGGGEPGLRPTSYEGASRSLSSLPEFSLAKPSMNGSSGGSRTLSVLPVVQGGFPVADSAQSSARQPVPGMRTIDESESASDSESIQSDAESSSGSSLDMVPNMPNFAGATPGASKTMSALPIFREFVPEQSPGPGASRSMSALPPMPAMSPATPSRGGNSLVSLDCLLPPKPPFEDVQMLCLVSRGSFGRVYKARWGVSAVAVKVVEHFDQRDENMIFEGALATSIAHPNLVQTFKYSVRELGNAKTSQGNGGEAESLTGCEVWIVQEWCSLGTLSRKLARKELVVRGDFGEVIECCTEIASAASYLHSRGIIHGDLTAANVLLVEKRLPKGYTTKVCDFGLARVLDSGASGIQTTTMGTVTYMPPELFQLEGFLLTKKVDVYAFGVIMWQLCTSETPFQGLQPTQVVVMVAQGATLQMPGTVPASLVQVFQQTIARKPEDRPFFETIVHELLKIAKLVDG